MYLYWQKILTFQLYKYNFNQTLKGFNPQLKPSEAVIGYICGPIPLSKSQPPIDVLSSHQVDLEKQGNVALACSLFIQGQGSLGNADWKSSASSSCDLLPEVKIRPYSLDLLSPKMFSDIFLWQMYFYFVLIQKLF